MGVKLTDITLTMMVRDELMNPAGGLKSVIERQISFYDEVLICDTGSKDGTRELLEHLEGKFSNLKVIDLPFEGYGQTRDKINSFVKSKYSLVLDADELLLEKSIKIIKDRVENRIKKQGYNLYGYNLYSVEKIGSCNNAWDTRLFDVNNVRFYNKIWESNEIGGEVDSICEAAYFHFVPKFMHSKNKEWYDNLSENMNFNLSPSQTANWHMWKIPDRCLMNKFGVNIGKEIKDLQKLDLNINSRILNFLDENFYLNKNNFDVSFPKGYDLVFAGLM